MTHSHHFHHAFHHARREAAPQTEDPVLPLPHIPSLEVPSPATPEKRSVVIEARKSSSSCGPNDNSGRCEKPTGSNTVPIVLAAVIPIVIALCVLVWIHQRHVKKQKLEDEKDPHKSLDFGLDEPSAAGGKNGGKGIPEMSINDAEKSVRGDKGMSMDLMSSPYLLPAGLQGSRESFHSMSRSLNDPDDPYRPVVFMKGDGDSVRSFPRSMKHDNASVYTGQSGSSGGTDRMNGSLLKNAQRMSHSYPSRGDSMSPSDKSTPQINVPEPIPSGPLNQNTAPVSPQNGGLAPGATQADRDSYFDKNASAMRKSNNYLGSFIHSQDLSTDKEVAKPANQSAEKPAELPAGPVDRDLPPVTESKSNQAPTRKPAPRLQSMEATVHNSNTKSIVSETSDYGDGFKVTPPSPPRQGLPPRQQSLEAPVPVSSEQYNGLGVQGLEPDQRRLSLVMRPLPPDDPTDNPEQRANRIRSFYKEYFDDSKPDPQGQYGDYYEDYGQEYLDGTIYDPDSGQFVVGGAPYAQPITRRAMTPPPRAPPRHFGGRGHMQTGSTGTGRLTAPRGRSAMSNRHPPPKKNLPPPSPLSSLPTPHMLKEDSMVFNPIDFAPPTTYRDRQAGRRPDSPLGVSRPFSPAVRPHTPLASSFDALNVIPSPHALRKSGTFTSLDFAPPPRFRDAEGGSDAASIRSNGSGMSAMQLHSLRAGAYRVSRIPKELAGTKDDIANALKPSWDLRT